MKVLFVNTNDTYGGAARAAMRIMRGVQQSGVEAQMFVKDKYSKSLDVIPASNFAPSSNLIKDIFKWVVQKFKNRYHMFKWHPYKHTKQNVFMSDMQHTDIYGALQNLDYDIIHLHWINNRFLDIRELAKIHKPIIWTLHDSWPFCGVCHVTYGCKHYENSCGACPVLGSNRKYDLAYEVFENKSAIYRNLNLHIVTPSKWLGECAQKSTLFRRFPITVIPNCIDTDTYMQKDKRQIRLQLGLDAYKRYILFGAMQATKDPNKGFSLLREALQYVKMNDVELLIYGTDEVLEKYSISLPVRQFGYVWSEESMAQLYNAVDVTIVPSLSENLSNTIMESMACGTPVVAFNVGGNSDMLDHKQNGYLAKNRDSKDLANGVIWCLTHNMDNMLGVKAREKVINNFTMEKISAQYISLYNTLCK